MIQTDTAITGYRGISLWKPHGKRDIFSILNAASEPLYRSFVEICSLVNRAFSERDSKVAASESLLCVFTRQEQIMAFAGK